MHTISAEQLLKAYNGKYKYVAQDSDHKVYLTEKEPIIASCLAITSFFQELGKIAITEFQGKDWKNCIYKAKPSEEDWVGCVGWFWDGEHEFISSNKNLGILEWINSNDDEPYKKESGLYFQHFRPARPDEIKFFNDDTSEN